jgi:uncharacterized membrane protein
MSVQVKRILGTAIFTLLYPLTAVAVRNIPDPMVPGAILALNMIFPVLAGYFYGPWSGAVAGAVGTALSALLRGSPYDGLAVLPHLIMGLAAGWSGRYRSDLLSAFTILIGHTLNIIAYTYGGLLTVSANWLATAPLGLAVESTIDIIAIVLVMTVLKHRLYQTERW